MAYLFYRAPWPGGRALGMALARARTTHRRSDHNGKRALTPTWPVLPLPTLLVSIGEERSICCGSVITGARWSHVNGRPLTPRTVPDGFSAAG